MVMNVLVCQEVMLTADIAAMWDSVVYNPGFIVVKPTNASKQVYLLIKKITRRSPTTDDQTALNRAINIFRSQRLKLNLTRLNESRFLGGWDYFEKPQRWFAPKEKCNSQKQDNCAVVVHNTWIVTKAAKVYRFREHLMWMYDGDDKYFSSNTRLYLMYNNHSPSTITRRMITKSEISALKTALTIGYLLNRTVILPRFHSTNMAHEVPLNYILHVKSFDDEFAGAYRENSFLRHPKVPLDVKVRLSAALHQATTDGYCNLTLFSGNVAVSSADILHQFGHVNHQVLNFGSLHCVTIVLRNSRTNVAFHKKLSQAFFRSNYRQQKRYSRW